MIEINTAFSSLQGSARRADAVSTRTGSTTWSVGVLRYVCSNDLMKYYMP